MYPVAHTFLHPECSLLAVAASSSAHQPGSSSTHRANSTMRDQSEAAIDLWPASSSGTAHQQDSQGAGYTTGPAFTGRQWWPDELAGQLFLP